MSVWQDCVFCGARVHPPEAMAGRISWVAHRHCLRGAVELTFNGPRSLTPVGDGIRCREQAAKRCPARFVDAGKTRRMADCPDGTPAVWGV